MQATTNVTAIDGGALNYESVMILTLVEEDGKLKVVELKDFVDPENHNAFLSAIAKTLAKKAATS